jgi:hypothetical protein
VGGVGGVGGVTLRAGAGLRHLAGVEGGRLPLAQAAPLLPMTAMEGEREGEGKGGG